ncbi:MAG: aromatic ring-hydroxylating oxygenase subunit alpha [Bacteroidota bacterium]
MEHSESPIYPDDLKITSIETAETIPSAWYTSHQIWETEKTALLDPFWQYVMPAEWVSEPGDQVPVQVAGQPIVVVRDKQGQLQAFYNVCRHRGGPLACKREQGSMLQCKYHGWTYRLDGMLRGVPQFQKTDLFNKEDYGLIPVSVLEWQGLVFVRLVDEGPPLEQMLAGMTDRIQPNDLNTKQFYKRVTYDIACNWKVYVDNYLEGYHVPIVHPELAKLLDYKQYVTETEEYHSLQYSPFQQGKNIYSEDSGEAFYYFVFPNYMFNILPGRLQMNIVEPVDAGHCRIHFDYYYDDVDSPGREEAIQEDLGYSEQIQQEDIEICEYVQKGLESNGYDKGRYSAKREQGVYHFHNLIRGQFKTYLK